jgi:hypothetical protein
MSAFGRAMEGVFFPSGAKFERSYWMGWMMIMMWNGYI